MIKTEDFTPTEPKKAPILMHCSWETKMADVFFKVQFSQLRHDDDKEHEDFHSFGMHMQHMQYKESNLL